MASVSWTDQALEDLDAICLFIGRDTPQTAMLFAARFFAATEQLEEFPLSGRMVPEIGRESLRELVVGSYRVIYRWDSERSEVDILTGHHGARLLSDLA